MTEIQYATSRRSPITPTQRSVFARLRYRSLDGGWIDVSLWRATRIRVFPKNAVIDKKSVNDREKNELDMYLSSKFHRAVKFCNCLRVFTSSKIFHFHDFSAMRLQSTELFFNISVLLIWLLHAPCQQTIKYLLCFFSLLNGGIRQSCCCLCFAVRLRSK